MQKHHNGEQVDQQAACDTVSCLNCPFGGLKVQGRGNPNSPFVLVGEGPGLNELKTEIPFSGDSGKLLHKIVPEDADYYILNAMECMPHKDKTRAQMEQGILSCKGRLYNELAKAPRKVIVALGGVAASALTDDLGIKITQVRGTKVASPLAEVGIVLTIHPAYILRGGGKFDHLKADLEWAMQLAGGIETADTVKWKPPVSWPLWPTPEAQELYPKLLAAIEVSGDIETSGFNYIKDSILTVSFADIADPSKVLVVPGDRLEDIRPLIERGVTWQNGKFDIRFLRHRGYKAYVDDDTMILHYCLDELRGTHDLEQLMADMLRAPDYKHMIKPWLPNKKSSYSLIPMPVLAEYTAIDTSGTAQIKPILWEKVASDPATEKLYTQILIPLSETLTRIEMYGIAVDPIRVAENKVWLGAALDAATKEFQAIAGWEINPNSPPQVAKLLYDQLRIKQTRYKRSTAKEVIALLPRISATIALTKCRVLSKALSTYTDSFLDKRDNEGRIHTSFLIHGTPTGRLASKDPNLQNIPRDPRFKGMFIAPAGRRFVDVDLNQAELRSLACCSGDAFLCSIYRDNKRSLHKEVAKDRYGENYTPDQLIRAKAVNFGITYGREAYSIAEEFSCTKAEAQADIDAWWARSPGAKVFVDRCRQAARRGETLKTPFGRRRRFGIVSREMLKHAENQAANFPHQSISNDITLTAAIEILPKLEALDSHIVNLVHDNILAETPDDDVIAAQVEAIIVEALQRKPIEWGLTRIPFLAEAKQGYRWGALEGGNKLINAYREDQGICCSCKEHVIHIDAAINADKHLVHIKCKGK